MELRFAAGESDQYLPIAAARDWSEVLRHQFHFAPAASGELTPLTECDLFGCGLRLSADDELREELIRQLLRLRRIAISELECRHGIEFRSYFAIELTRLSPCFRLGLVQDFGDRIEVCSQKWPWLRNIALCFDAFANNNRLWQEAWRRH
jgi:hypothetical protein